MKPQNFKPGQSKAGFEKFDMTAKHRLFFYNRDNGVLKQCCTNTGPSKYILDKLIMLVLNAQLSLMLLNCNYCAGIF